MGKKRVVSSVRPRGERSLSMVMLRVVGGEMLMPSRKMAKLGFV